MSVPFIKDFDDFAESMAVPNPNRPIQEAVASLGRAACNRISARPDIFAPTILQSPLVAACTPYWNSQGYSEPSIEPPFLGGQCVGVTYRISYTIGQYSQAAGSAGTLIDSNSYISDRIGPIGAPVLNWLGMVNLNSCLQRNYEYRVTFQGGSFALNLQGSTSRPWTQNPPSSNCVEPYRVDSFSVSRLDGLPDNCGNPPDVIEPGPNPAPDPGPLPPGTGPTINARGEVIFVLPGAIQITPTLEVGLNPGEINLGSGTGNSAPVEPLPGDEQLGTGSGDGGGENEFGAAPDGERWVGCCIRITSTPIGSGVIPSSIPHDVYPTIIGNARLRFQSGASPAQYDTPIQNRAETSCLWESVRGLNPVGAFVNLLPGYSYTVTPYSIPLEQ